MPAVEVHYLRRKRYRLLHVKANSLKEAALSFMRGQCGCDESWALHPISFGVAQDEDPKEAVTKFTSPVAAWDRSLAEAKARDAPAS